MNVFQTFFQDTNGSSGSYSLNISLIRIFSLQPVNKQIIGHTLSYKTEEEEFYKLLIIFKLQVQPELNS